MRKIGRQEGMTMWSMVSLALIGIFFLLLSFKLIPPYVNDFKIGSAIERVAIKAGAGSKSAAELLASLEKMFDVNYISNINPRQDIEIQPLGENAKLIKLEYEVVIPLSGNLSALIYFEHEHEAH